MRNSVSGACLSLLIFHFLAIGLLEGQKNGYPLEHFGVNEGLSQGTVREILPDSRGYLWLSTSDGLNRFDGQKFEIFKPILGDSTSLAGVRIFEMMEDSDGRIWISHELGLSRFDYRNSRFFNFFFKKSAESDLIKFVSCDQIGGVWTISKALKLIQWDRISIKKRLEIDLQTTKSVDENQFRRMESYQDSSYSYLNFPSQTLRLNLKTGAHQMLNSPNLGHETTDQKRYFFPKKNNYSPRLPSNIQNQLNFDDYIWLKNGRWWISNARGVVEIQKNEIPGRQILKEPYCTRMVRDKNDNIWIGSETQGVFKFSPTKIKFGTYKMPQSPQPLIVSVAADFDSNHVYVGTFDGFLAIFDRKNGFERQFKVGKYALAVCPFAENQVLVQDYALNLKIIDSRNGRTVRNFEQDIRAKLSDASILGGVSAFLVPDKMGRFLFHNGNKLLRIQSETARSAPIVEVIAQFSEEIDLKCAWFDSRNQLWVGGNASAYLVDYQTFNVKKLTLPGNFEVRSFAQKSNNQIWVATTTGLLKLDQNGQFQKHFGAADGLVNQYIYGILADSKGRFWISSNHGLMVFDPENPVFQNFTVKDGLQGNEYNGGSFCTLSNGWMAFAGTDGVNIFDPIIYGKYENLPVAILTEWHENDQILPLFDQKRVFSHEQNQFGFGFKSQDLSDPNGMFFRFRLVGFESEWQLADAGRSARYTNLSPGNYQFEVETARSNRIWGASTFSAPFEIEKAIWQRWWFYLLETMAVLGLFWFIFDYYAQKKLAKQRSEIETQFRVQAERARISRDLHDNVGAQLSNIVQQVENLAELTTRDQSKEISQVRDSAKTAIYQLRETIWAIHKDKLSGEDLADKIKSWSLQQTRHRPEIQIYFEENFEKNMVLSPTEALQIFRISQETLHNSLKYAFATEINFQLFSTQKHRFYLKISDNGCGFELNQANLKGYGLQNMMHRAKEIGATLDISTIKNVGTTIELWW